MVLLPVSESAHQGAIRYHAANNSSCAFPSLRFTRRIVTNIKKFINEISKGYDTSEIMGNLISTSIRKIVNECLDERLGNLEARLEKRFDRLENLTGDPAKRKAKQITVHLELERGSSSSYACAETISIGHGMIVKLEGIGYFILTAAHVIVQMCDYFKKNKDWSLAFAFISNSEKKYRLKRDKLKVFIPQAYIEKGSEDVGFLKFQHGKMRTLKSESVTFDDDDPLDLKYFGRNANFVFEGCPFTCQEGRVKLLIPSKPGCSGTPLVTLNGHVGAVVHGETKHRAIRHSTLGNSGTDSDGTSNHVFVDCVEGIKNLVFWYSFDFLIAVENLSVTEHLLNPDKKLKTPELEGGQSSEPPSDHNLPSDPSAKAVALYESVEPSVTNGFFTIGSIIGSKIEKEKEEADKGMVKLADKLFNGLTNNLLKAVFPYPS